MFFNYLDDKKSDKMEVSRINEIARNLANYLCSVDVISEEEKTQICSRIPYDVHGGYFKECFNIIKRKCSGIMTEAEFYDVLEQEVGIHPEELEELKTMKFANTDELIMALPTFTEEIER